MSNDISNIEDEINTLNEGINQEVQENNLSKEQQILNQITSGSSPMNVMFQDLLQKALSGEINIGELLKLSVNQTPFDPTLKPSSTLISSSELKDTFNTLLKNQLQKDNIPFDIMPDNLFEEVCNFTKELRNNSVDKEDYLQTMEQFISGSGKFDFDAMLAEAEAEAETEYEAQQQPQPQQPQYQEYEEYEQSS